jgi:hypothetical protein
LRKITTGVLTAVIVTIGGAAGFSGTAIAPAGVAVTANSTHKHADTSVRWEEDSLPPELYLWTQQNSGDLQRWGTYDGHRNCWAAVADTTLIMCPDGWYTYS